MTDKPQPDKFDWATELSDAQGHVTLSAQEAKEIGARLRSMRVKLKTYEDFGDAGSDVQLLRTGYAAARLEIESLRAGVPTSQPVVHHGEVYAALPEPITYQIAVLKACEHGDALVGWRVEPSRQSFDASMRPKRKLYTEGNMHDFADRTHALRVSHWQAPAQETPTYKDSTPELHIGDSAFESWYSSYNPMHKGDKQRACDAYAAGMGDSLVMAAPAPAGTNAQCSLYKSTT